MLDRDGFLTNPEHYKVGIELQRRDRILLESFAKAIKLDLNKCKIRDFIKEHDKECKKYEMSALYVCCKPLFNDLLDIGLSNSKTSREFMPETIKNLVSKAKDKAVKLNLDWRQVKEGKIALTWLLGCYDGDGCYVGKTHN